MPGRILPIGTYTLGVTFFPTDAVDFWKQHGFGWDVYRDQGDDDRRLWARRRWWWRRMGAATLHRCTLR